MTGHALRVEAFTSFEALAPLAPAIDALNLASRAPRLSGCFAFTRCFAEHELLYLTARAGDELVGYLPLRRRRERLAGFSYGCIETLVDPYEAGRVVARPEHEARCAEAFFRHLVEAERGWSVLSFPRQDSGSPLSLLPDLDDALVARRHAAMDRAILPLPFGSLAEYARSRPASWRSSVGRNVRKLFGAGDVELLRCARATHPRALLDLYLDIERRSWKARARPPVDATRQPGLVDFYRALLDPALGFAHAPVFSFVLLDGHVVSGLFAIPYAGTSFWRELAYDEDAERLGPGTLSVLLGIGDALEQGCHAIDFGAGLDYKARWGADFRPSWDFQLLRAGSLPFWRALAGMARRRVAAAWRRAGAQADAKAAATDARAAPRAREAATLGLPLAPDRHALARALEASGARVERLARTALEGRLPFSTR